MRIAPVLLVATGLLLAAPSTATADVIFDPADADDLAAVLAEAYTDQNVCYGWEVTVSDPISGTSESVGSNFGAGEQVRSSSCEATVTFRADITYTSESSEAEDSASYDVSSNPAGVTRAELDDLGIDFGGLTGEDPDVPIGQAVTALPLLAADAGIGKPISAAPATGEAPADAQLTDNPNSDWWRNQGGMVMWALIVIAAGGVFAWWVLRTERRKRARARRRGYPKGPTPPPYQSPGIVAAELPPDPEPKAPEPPTEELPVQEPPAPEPPTEELPVQEPAAEEPPASEQEPAAEAAAAKPAESPASEQRPAEDAAETPAAESSTAKSTEVAEEQAAGSGEAEPSAAEPSATEREPADQAAGPAEAEPATAKPADPPVATSPPESTVDKPADPEPGDQEQARPAPSDQKDKE